MARFSAMPFVLSLACALPAHPPGSCCCCRSHREPGARVQQRHWSDPQGAALQEPAAAALGTFSPHSYPLLPWHPSLPLLPGNPPEGAKIPESPHLMANRGSLSCHFGARGGLASALVSLQESSSSISAVGKRACQEQRPAERSH